ncbi:hypothetical protein GCM10009788_07320 [Nocardioides humi]|uniref:Uncharacterized protein n=1 Tax=Nocardioides humi TaxID=449461 RepID=A0ABN1ZWK9_9ACTN
MTVLVPSKAMLVDEPGGGERIGADLLLRGLRGLQGRRDNDESSVLPVEGTACGGEGGGLAGAGRAFDNEYACVAGQSSHDVPLRGAEMVGSSDAGFSSDRLLRALP